MFHDCADVWPHMSLSKLSKANNSKYNWQYASCTAAIWFWTTFNVFETLFANSLVDLIILYGSTFFSTVQPSGLQISRILYHFWIFEVVCWKIRTVSIFWRLKFQFDVHFCNLILLEQVITFLLFFVHIRSYPSITGIEIWTLNSAESDRNRDDQLLKCTNQG